MADRNDTTCTMSSDTESDYSEGSFSDSDSLIEDDAGMFPTESSCRMGHFGDRSCIQPYQFEPAIEVSDTDEVADVMADEEDSGSDRLLNTNWCSCDNCQLMSSVSESVCCQDLGRVYEKCPEDDPPASCITHHTYFRAVCLNKAVLDTAYYQYRQQYEALDTKRPDERYRYVAYRQLVRWCWKYLGKEIRRVLPSCAVSCIRSTFPSPNGEYVGFKLV